MTRKDELDKILDRLEKNPTKNTKYYTKKRINKLIGQRIEQILFSKIYFIGEKLPQCDDRMKFVVLGSPQEFIDLAAASPSRGSNKL